MRGLMVKVSAIGNRMRLALHSWHRLVLAARGGARSLTPETRDQSSPMRKLPIQGHATQSALIYSNSGSQE